MKIPGFKTSSMFLIVGFFLSITILVSGCSESSQATNGTTKHISASWAEWYTNLASLKQHSDIAIAGKITAIADQTVKMIYHSLTLLLASATHFMTHISG